MFAVDEGMQELRFNNEAIPFDVTAALREAQVMIESNLRQIGSSFLEACTENNRYRVSTNTGWTTGFWTGLVWIAYELTGDDYYKEIAELHVQSFDERLDLQVDVDHHDIGFLYSLSCVAAYKITGSERAKSTALKAADHLLKVRYDETVGIIRCWSWGKYGQPGFRSNMIIDSLMNMPLLYWASEVTGNPAYRDAAYRHAINAMNYSVRPDASTYHMFFFDEETGKPKYGETAQGYADDSCWSRGQSWGIYGFMLNYIYTKDERFLETARRLANYFLNRSSSDLVAFWDLQFDDNSGEPKDSSASAITVCGLLEMIKWLPSGDSRDYYANAANQILKQLYDHYTSRHDAGSNALLLHGVGSIPHNSGVDEGNLFGDYFYLEALIRSKKDWQLYW